MLRDGRRGLIVDEWIWQSASSLARAIQEKKISAEELIKLHLERIEAVNPTLNAVVQLVADRALSEARKADASLARGEVKGPLHGVPMTLKDSIDTEGVITTGGTKGRQNFVPERDATVAARLRSAGAILLGKTNTPELTFGIETDNLVYGRTNNPYDLNRTPGGSSGGAAAIVASGGSPFDLGSDTGGSIRYPAHACGIAGIKPTSGRVPRTGHIIPYGLGAVDSKTQIGPLARYVEDLALILPIISGVDWEDPAIVPMPLGAVSDVALNELRIAVHTDSGVRSPTSEIRKTVQEVADSLIDTGSLVKEDVPGSLGIAAEINKRVGSGDGRAWFRRLLDKAGTKECHPWSERVFDSATPSSSIDFAASLEALDAFRSDMLSFLENYDAILCPVFSQPATHHGKTREEADQGGGSYLTPYNLTGWPAAVVRAGTSAEGLPIGVQVVARPWREDVAIAVAQHVESAFGGWQRPPL